MNSRRADRPLLAALLLVAAFASGCRTVVVSPDRIDSSDSSDKDAALANLREAVVVLNRFLASPWNLSLPRGRYEIDAHGLTFVAPEGNWPMTIYCTSWGDVVLCIGGAAQAIEGGFIVGSRPPEEDGAIDNSLFRRATGELRPPESIAATVLHETAHVVHRTGTIGFWNGTAYFLEAVFLLRAARHSAERRPRASSEELAFFTHFPDELEELERHVREGESDCEHGPYEETPRGPAAAR